MLGKAIPRKEDERFLTGAGLYVADVARPGMLHVAFVRSVHAHACIRGVSADKARQVPGVVAVVTGSEWPELGAVLPELNGSVTLTSPYIDSIRLPPHNLFPKKACYVGEQIAAVVAGTAYAAQDGAEAVAVDYEALPAVASWQDAIRPQAPRIHAGFSNVVAHLKHEVGDTDHAFRDAQFVVSRRLETQSLKSMALECRAVAAEWSAETGTLNVWSTCQFPYLLRDTLASILNLPAEAIRIFARDIGGGFGLKGVLHAEDVIVPLMARRLQRPLRWIETRSEHMTASNHSGAQTTEARLAARGDGTILALDVRLFKEVGAYDHFDMMLQINTINHLTTHYKVPSLRAEGWAVATNTSPGSPYRGAGRVEASFVMDRMLDALARTAGIDPFEVRMKNIIAPAELPYRNGMIYRDGVPVTYDAVDFPLLLRTARERIGYEVWRRRQSDARRAGRRVGIGISSYVEAGGLGPCEGSTISVDEAGRVTVKVGVNSQGQGHETTLAQVCASTLGAAIDSVEVRAGDTALLHAGFGTGASRVAVNSGNAVHKAAASVRRKAAALAAHAFGCTAAEIEIADGMVTMTGASQNRMTLGQLAQQAVRDRRMADLGGPGLTATEFFYPRTVTWASGVNIAVVEVEADTGAITILDYVFVHDCGQPINPAIVEGQISGGFAQGLGIALGECVRYASDGQVLTGSLMDYVVPRACDVPPIRVVHLHFPTTDNPLGVKSVGESGPNAPPAAIAAAVEDALSGAVQVNSLPVSAEFVWRALGSLSICEKATQAEYGETPCGSSTMKAGRRRSGEPVS